jgi:hypothetical protein
MLNCEDLLEGVIPGLDELANGLRLNTEVPSQDLSGAWVTVRWVRASQGTCRPQSNPVWEHSCFFPE